MRDIQIFRTIFWSQLDLFSWGTSADLFSHSSRTASLFQHCISLSARLRCKTGRTNVTDVYSYTLQFRCRVNHSDFHFWSWAGNVPTMTPIVEEHPCLTNLSWTQYAHRWEVSVFSKSYWWVQQQSFWGCFLRICWVHLHIHVLSAPRQLLQLRHPRWGEV